MSRQEMLDWLENHKGDLSPEEERKIKIRLAAENLNRTSTPVETLKVEEVLAVEEIVKQPECSLWRVRICAPVDPKNMWSKDLLDERIFTTFADAKNPTPDIRKQIGPHWQLVSVVCDSQAVRKEELNKLFWRIIGGIIGAFFLYLLVLMIIHDPFWGIIAVVFYGIPVYTVFFRKS